MRRRTAITIIVGVVLVGGFLLFKWYQKNVLQQGGGIPVSVASALSKEVQVWDAFSGRIEATDKVEIRARVSGTVDAIRFEEGQLVKKGQPLFIIDPKPFKAESARAEAVLAAAEAQASFAAAEYKRAENLVEDQSISKREYDERKNGHLSAVANVKSARAAANQAALNLGYTTIIAPISGRVSRAEVTVGNLVNAGGEGPILTSIVAMDPIYVHFDVDEASFIRYLEAHDHNPEKLKHAPVKIMLSDNSNMTYEGVIKSFDNALDARSGTVRVRAVFDNKKGALIPGLFVHVKLSGTGLQKPVLIHERAINTDQNKRYVYVVGKDNKVEYREVSLGASVDNLRIIREGVKPGEGIVVNGLQHVRPGAVVTPQMVSMETLTAEANQTANEAPKQ